MFIISDYAPKSYFCRKHASLPTCTSDVHSMNSVRPILTIRWYYQKSGKCSPFPFFICPANKWQADKLYKDRKLCEKACSVVK